MNRSNLISGKVSGFLVALACAGSVVVSTWYLFCRFIEAFISVVRPYSITKIFIGRSKRVSDSFSSIESGGLAVLRGVESGCSVVVEILAGCSDGVSDVYLVIGI